MDYMCNLMLYYVYRYLHIYRKLNVCAVEALELQMGTIIISGAVYKTQGKCHLHKDTTYIVSKSFAIYAEKIPEKNIGLKNHFQSINLHSKKYSFSRIVVDSS